MKFQIILSILSSVLLLSCGTGSRRGEICDCFRLLVNEVDARQVDFNSDNVESTLKEIYDGLKANNEDFKECSDDFVKRYGTFGRAKIGLVVGLNDDCTDLHETLSKIAEKGPLIFEMK